MTIDFTTGVLLGLFSGLILGLVGPAWIVRELEWRRTMRYRRDRRGNRGRA